MYRIPVFICLSCFLGGFAVAADGEAAYRIGWTTANGTVFGAMFQASQEEASTRLAWANRVDPSTKRWLVQPPPAARESLIAQPPAEQHRQNMLYRISMAAVMSSNAMDIASSYGKQEVNPLFRGSGGTFDARSAALKAGLVGGLQVFNYLVIRKHPEYLRRATLMNFVSTAIFTGLAVHNLGIHAGH